jgi:hypothetical protein
MTNNKSSRLNKLKVLRKQAHLRRRNLKVLLRRTRILSLNLLMPNKNKN